jgi:hypothetical protein
MKTILLLNNCLPLKSLSTFEQTQEHKNGKSEFDLIAELLF